MLELLEKWAELEPEKVAIDTYNDLMFRPERNCTFSVTLVSNFPDVEPDNSPAIEYAVRDAIEARSAGYMVETLSLGTYLAVVRRSGDTYDHSASSPAEAILAAYVAFLESGVQE